MSGETQWWLSTDMIGKPGSPKTAGPFSTRDDAFNARTALEAIGANLSVFEEEVKPAVELPTEPTLGFVTAAGGRTSAAIAGLSSKFSPIRGSGRIYVRAGDPFGFGQIERITAFTPATAVPTEALDDWRESHAISTFKHDCTVSSSPDCKFLKAIDEANA